LEKYGVAKEIRKTVNMEQKAYRPVIDELNTGYTKISKFIDVILFSVHAYSIEGMTFRSISRTISVDH